MNPSFASGIFTKGLSSKISGEDKEDQGKLKKKMKKLRAVLKHWYGMFQEVVLGEKVTRRGNLQPIM